MVLIQDKLILFPLDLRMLADGSDAMRVIIKVAKKDSAKAWGVIVRHSAATALPGRIFIVSPGAAQALRDSGVRFKEISREAGEATAEGMATGERI
jgi:hypothetical protein